MTFLLHESNKKYPDEKRQYFGPFIVCLFAGLATAQIIATLHVYLSNTSLFHTLTTIDEAGYLAVPNGWIIRNLQSFASAFYGGLFFDPQRRGRRFPSVLRCNGVMEYLF